jgi:hypothetical protein
MYTYNRTIYSSNCDLPSYTYPEKVYLATVDFKNDTVTSKRGPRKGRPGKQNSIEVPNPFKLIKSETEYGYDHVGGSYRHKIANPDTTLCDGMDIVRAGNVLAMSSSYRRLVKSHNGGVVEDPDLLKGLMHDAKLKAYGDANGPKCPGLVWLGEGRETLETLGSIARTASGIIRGHARTLRDLKRRYGRTKEYLDRVADAWLTYQFAIIPLIIQAEEVADLLGEKEKEETSFTGNANSGAKHVDNNVYAYGFNGVTTHFKRTVKVKWVGVAKLFPAAKKDPNPYGFGSYDLLLAAWELLRASWFIDYFLNVGRYLDAYRPGGAEIKYQSNTTIYEAVTKIEPAYTDGEPLPGWTPKIKFGSSAHTQTIIERTTEVDRPALPRFRSEALLVSQVANQVAFIYKQMSRVGHNAERGRKRLRL